MAGRGCTITVKLLGNGNSSDNPEEMSLPVALHSPLEVLKGQLSEITGIPPADQVLILCDLSDPDRNSDILLAGRDHMSLVQCGIRNGSVLTLHPLGMSAEQKQKMLKEAFSEKKMEVYDRPVYSLDTYIKPADADHSYNGIIFDVESNGPFEVDLLSVSIAGMLGRIVRLMFLYIFLLGKSPCFRGSSREIGHGEQVLHEQTLLTAGGHIEKDWEEKGGH